MTETSSLKRQQWLEVGVAALRTRFSQIGHAVPDNVRVSIGWPKGRHGKHAIGQCWYAEMSSDKHNELFVSPELADGARILDVLAHELAHAVAGHEAGHKKPFKRIAEAIGLTGKMTATVAGPEFTIWAQEHIAREGQYPAGSLTAGSGIKKQTTRLLKCQCSECGYTVRVASKWLEEGAPICPIDEAPMEQIIS